MKSPPIWKISGAGSSKAGYNRRFRADHSRDEDTPLAKTLPIKPEEQFAVSYADQLILTQLTEMESAVKLGELADRLSDVGLGLSAVRSLLASDPDRFAYHERRWIPAARLLAQGRPVAEAVAIILRAFGGPVSVTLIATELGRVRQQDPSLLENTVRRVASGDDTFILTGKDEVALYEWGFQATDESVERALGLNRVSHTEFEQARQKLHNIDWRGPDAIEKALKAAAPIRSQVLGAVAYASLNGGDARSVLLFNARDFFARVLSAPGFVFAPDQYIHSVDDARKWISTASRVADRLAPSIEVEDAAPIEIKPEDVQSLATKIVNSDASVTASRLLEENYEITIANKTFPDDLANIMAALKADKQVQWVGGDRFRRAGSMPEYIYEVPEPFQFEQSTAVDEEGELIDLELTDDGLSSTLRKLLQHPLATDVLDEDVQPAPKSMPESVRLVLKSIHRELGTFPLCQIPTGWLSPDPKLQELIFIDPNGRELQVWMNTEGRLMYNLIDWWYEQQIENGAVFTLTKTARPNVLDFQWLDQPDPVVYISTQRMEELRQIGSTAEGRSTLDLLIEVMNHWPKGADYLTLLAEVNVVRRSRRRLIASLLSSYQCFYQRSGSPVWHFDPKKVDQGFDKTKRKFVKK